MELGKRLAAQAAQVIGQALTGWSLLVLWANPDIGVAMLTLLMGIAMALPLRTKGTDHDRAISNFGSGLVVWSVIAVGLFWTMLEKMLFGDPGYPLSTFQTLLLAATVMYMTAGGLFWVLARDEREG